MATTKLVILILIFQLNSPLMNINIKGVKDRVTHIKYLDYIAHLGLQKTFHRNSFGRKRLQYSQHSYSIKVFTFNCSILGPHFSSFCKSQLCTLSPNLVHTDHDGSRAGRGSDIHAQPGW